MVTVHSFMPRGSDIIAPTKRTAKQIKQMHGDIVPGTAEEVDAATIDDNGRYIPPGKKAK